MSQGSDVAVIGAGIVGLATAYSLLERGLTVTVFERGQPGHGQSGGDSRIFRHAHDDPRLVRLAVQSRAVWREWEHRLGVELVSTDGVVALGPTAEARLQVMDQVGGVPARRIGAAELAERLPLLAGYDGIAVLDEAGGSIRTRAAIAALATELRDALVADEVLAVRPTGAGRAEVRAGGVCAEYTSVVVCAGRGTTALAAGLGWSVPVDHAAHVRLTFAVRGGPPDRLACLQDGSGRFGETGVYAAPVPGNRGYALGLSETVPLTADGGVADADRLRELSDRAAGYVSLALPGLDPEPVDYRHCWTTELPWDHDGMGVWALDGIFFIAGHNLFKHAPALGRALAAAVAGEGLAPELVPEAQLGHVDQGTGRT